MIGSGISDVAVELARGASGTRIRAKAGLTDLTELRGLSVAHPAHLTCPAAQAITAAGTWKRLPSFGTARSKANLGIAN